MKEVIYIIVFFVVVVLFIGAIDRCSGPEIKDDPMIEVQRRLDAQDEKIYNLEWRIYQLENDRR